MTTAAVSPSMRTRTSPPVGLATARDPDLDERRCPAAAAAAGASTRGSTPSVHPRRRHRVTLNAAPIGRAEPCARAPRRRTACARMAKYWPQRLIGSRFKATITDLRPRGDKKKVQGGARAPRISARISFRRTSAALKPD